MLKKFNENEDKKLDFHNEALNLLSNLEKLEIVVLTTLWEGIPERFNVISKKVQNSELFHQKHF